MHTQQTVVAQIIQAIGEPDFAAITAESIRQYIAFELVAIVAHRRNSRPALLFDNFAVAGGHRGIENYIDVTYAVNPILVKAARHRGAFRARDFTIRACDLDTNLASYLVQSADEELGFRTVGWPERQEEIGLYFESGGEMVELSLYRPRGPRALDCAGLQELEKLQAPLAAAFNKHAALAPATASSVATLSAREKQVTQLLLRGCGSPQIALRLGISRHTVKDHRKQIFRKLGIGALAQLFALFRRPHPQSFELPPPGRDSVGGRMPACCQDQQPGNPHALRPDAD
jgi:DNA-binding CsgD family transcriptional regulator